MTLSIRELRHSDVPHVASLHDAAFPRSALTRLGTEAVRRYYQWLLEGPHQATTLAAIDKDELVGFVFGGVFNGAMTGFLQRNRGFLLARVLTHPWLLTTPLFRERIALAGRLLSRRRVSSVAPARRAFGILAIAVHPAAQRSGVGKLLMTRSEELARSRGFDRMQLTVAKANQQAVAFYLGRGWDKVRDGSGLWTGAMSKKLVRDRPDPIE